MRPAQKGKKNRGCFADARPRFEIELNRVSDELLGTTIQRSSISEKIRLQVVVISRAKNEMTKESQRTRSSW